MAEVKDAKKVFTLEDIKYNEKNRTMAILSCIPIVGLIMMFVEKEDMFVRYHAVQFATFNLLFLVAWIPLIGQLILLAAFVAVIVGMVKTSKGERFDVPGISSLALNIMGSL
jgi:uncharacterized membrane protein